MKSRDLIYVFVAAVLAVIIRTFISEACAMTIIGDSHVGGLKPYLSKYMSVQYKNGTTARYWMSQPVSERCDLIVMTGTNDHVAGVPTSVWLGRTDMICRKAERCWIIAPPPYAKAYRQALIKRKNVIWTTPRPTRDGVHFYASGYKAMAQEILQKTR